MDEFFIGVTKKIILIMIAAVVTVYGMVTYDPHELSGIGIPAIFMGLFLFFWTTFLYRPGIKIR